MTYKALRERLRAMRVFNSYEFCKTGGGSVFVVYTPSDTSRGGLSARWQVAFVHGTKPTDPTAAWYNYGMKTFLGLQRSAAKAEALSWTAEHYPIAGWARDPWGAYQSSDVAEQVMEALAVWEEKACLRRQKERV